MQDPLYDEPTETDTTSSKSAPEKPTTNYYLLAAQRAYGICSHPDCDRPITLWCTRCHAKTCAVHARVVQLLPDYHPATLCAACLDKAETDHEIDLDYSVISIHRPDYDPQEEPQSEANAAWWMAFSVERYVRLIETDAPALLIERELDILAKRLQQLADARQREREQVCPDCFGEGAISGRWGAHNGDTYTLPCRTCGGTGHVARGNAAAPQQEQQEQREQTGGGDQG